MRASAVQVLSLLSGPAHGRRRPADRALEGRGGREGALEARARQAVRHEEQVRGCLSDMQCYSGCPLRSGRKHCFAVNRSAQWHWHALAFVAVLYASAAPLHLNMLHFGASVAYMQKCQELWLSRKEMVHLIHASTAWKSGTVCCNSGCSSGCWLPCPFRAAQPFRGGVERACDFRPAIGLDLLPAYSWKTMPLLHQLNMDGRRAECRRWDDKSVSPVIRQSLLHWAYELTEADFKKISKEIKL